jgi:hypothetical protein
MSFNALATTRQSASADEAGMLDPPTGVEFPNRADSSRRRSATARGFARAMAAKGARSVTLRFTFLPYSTDIFCAPSIFFRCH